MGSLAYFVSPHGFGHAARASAVMEALRQRRPQIHFELFTAVPEWFFSESLPTCFTYHRIESDVGLVQTSSLEEDLEATVEKLRVSPLRDPAAVDALTRQLEELACTMVIADISPLGLKVAHRLGIPSVLIENFTWDWIYAGYSDAPDDLQSIGSEMAGVFADADLRIQTQPVCNQVEASTGVPPVARTPRCSRAETRSLLQVPEGDSLVLLSMGGVPWNFGLLDRLEGQDRAWIVVPGGSRQPERRGRLLLLPFHSGMYQPDLVYASDLVVGKLGYSTVAEAYAAGAAFAYVARPKFPESAVLARFVRTHLASDEISEQEFANGEWVNRITHLLDIRQRSAGAANGAKLAASAILARFPM
jgi:hypothetical protein